MLKAYQILVEGRKPITEAINEETIKQGHVLTGNILRAHNAEIDAKENETTLKAFVPTYSVIVDKGVKRERASFKQYPFMINYFLLRGYPLPEAKAFAAATINKWIKEGMSTFASRRFSKTRERQHFIRIALAKAGKKSAANIQKAFNVEIKSIFKGIKKTDTF